MTSPYRVALGSAFDDLHSRLRAYFDALPAGAVGRGDGVFETVGTPRRWLWPLLAAFSRAGVLFPVWQRNVPFTVENRPARRPDTAPAVSARRVFRLPGRSAVMVDEIGVRDGALVDRLGHPVVAEARFVAAVRDGGLRLRSDAVLLVAFGRRVRIPRIVAPRVALSERWDEREGERRVSVAVGLPVIGTIYQYRGRFRYRVVEEGEQDT